jgi:3-methyladenine DNA glycosylase AlkD
MTEATLPAIRTRLQAAANEQKARTLQRFFKTGPGDYGFGDVFIGITVPPLRKLAAEFRQAPVSAVKTLLKSRIHEERTLALMILVAQFQRGDARLQEKIYSLYLAHTRHINNWDLVDGSAPHIVGAFLDNRDRAPLYTLARSKSIWERRIAILSTQRFIRNRDFEDTLRIAEILLSDAHDLIHKAVGWMLREVGNRDRAVAERFLKQRYRTMPRTMLRYAIERFPETLRRSYLLGRV